jgi:hypothetical protein
LARLRIAPVSVVVLQIPTDYRLRFRVLGLVFLFVPALGCSSPSCSDLSLCAHLILSPLIFVFGTGLGAASGQADSFPAGSLLVSIPLVTGQISSCRVLQGISSLWLFSGFSPALECQPVLLCLQLNGFVPAARIVLRLFCGLVRVLMHTGAVITQP